MKNNNYASRENFTKGFQYLVTMDKPEYGFNNRLLIFKELEFEHNGDVCLLVFETEEGKLVRLDEDFLKHYTIYERMESLINIANVDGIELELSLPQFCLKEDKFGRYYRRSDLAEYLADTKQLKQIECEHVCVLTNGYYVSSL